MFLLRVALFLTIPLTLLSWSMGYNSTRDCDLLELRAAMSWVLWIGVIILGVAFLAFYWVRKKGQKISVVMLALAGILFLTNAAGWVYAFRIRNVVPTNNCWPEADAEIRRRVEQSLTPDKLISFLLAARDVKLDPQKNVGCTSEMGTTVGEYVSFLIGKLAESSMEKNVETKVRAYCRKPDPKDSPFLGKGNKVDSECRFEAYILDKASGDPWSFSLRFVLKPNGKEVDPAFLACPGN